MVSLIPSCFSTHSPFISAPLFPLSFLCSPPVPSRHKDRPQSQPFLYSVVDRNFLHSTVLTAVHPVYLGHKLHFICCLQLSSKFFLNKNTHYGCCCIWCVCGHVYHTACVEARGPFLGVGPFSTACNSGSQASVACKSFYLMSHLAWWLFLLISFLTHWLFIRLRDSHVFVNFSVFLLLLTYGFT